MEQLDIKIGENDIEVSDVPALNCLSKQLNSMAPVVGFDIVSGIMQRGTILTLRDIAKDNVLMGMGTLITIQKLFTICGSIEDIVVDEPYRGRGWGRIIVERLVNKGGIVGMKFVALTSSPNRIEANKLYQSIGFEKPNTILYRFYY